MCPLISIYLCIGTIKTLFFVSPTVFILKQEYHNKIDICIAK